MTSAKFIVCVFCLFWDKTMSMQDSCPRNCRVCNYGNQGKLVEVKCEDISFRDLPVTLKHIFISDAVGLLQLPFGRLTDFIFTARTALETLTIHNYAITSIQDGCFKTNKYLRTLDLSNNKIVSLKEETFQGLTRLTDLNLNRNRLAAINGSIFRHLISLRRLHLALNLIINIGEYDFYGLKYLLSLDLQSNKIESIHPSSFRATPNLEDINLLNNHLSTVGAGVFKRLNWLKQVNLRNNRIISLDKDCISSKSLLEVNLVQNNISVIPTMFLVTVSNPKLDVKLARNMIREIKYNELVNVCLKALYLSSNQISVIEPYAFQHTDIATIDLGQNNLTTIPTTVWYYLNASKILNLDNNPLSCDCELQWLAQSLEKTVTDVHQPTCARPRQYFGRKLIDIAENLTQNCNESYYIPPKQQPVVPDLKTPPKHSMATPQLRTTMSRTLTTKVITMVTATYKSKSNHSPKPVEQNKENNNNVPLIVGVCISIIILLCVIISVIVYKVTRPFRIIEPELTVPCRKPDTSFKTKLYIKWFDEVT